jgi:hypothetical protein
MPSGAIPTWVGIVNELRCRRMAMGRRWCVAIRFSSAALATVSGAGAQVHWDVTAQAGATDRIAGGSAPARAPGPSGEIHGHVAVYPMLRIGPYAAFDLSPASGLPDRQIYAAGLRIKATPPWLLAPWHAWGFLGFGLAYAYAPSSQSFPATSTTTPEVPFGAGLAYRLHGPWDLSAELGARWNLGGLGIARAPVFVGDDLLAVSLSVGVSLSL